MHKLPYTSLKKYVRKNEPLRCREGRRKSVTHTYLGGPPRTWSTGKLFLLIAWLTDLKKKRKHREKVISKHLKQHHTNKAKFNLLNYSKYTPIKHDLKNEKYNSRSFLISKQVLPQRAEWRVLRPHLADG